MEKPNFGAIIESLPKTKQRGINTAIVFAKALLIHLKLIIIIDDWVFKIKKIYIITLI
jgi:hypothetical protein